ncbi:hypothetical protein BDR06DRAFT_1002162 [Suillus hirtellus]|nr:hypothetical protein BDR06DRAFT_1002162 [Suillus hirtellus]
MITPLQMYRFPPPPTERLTLCFMLEHLPPPPPLATRCMTTRLLQAALMVYFVYIKLR